MADQAANGKSVRTIYEGAAQTAKRVRRLLKRQFPGVKFRVRSKTYSGGSSVDVSWTDAIRRESVERAVKWLESAEFDGMIDLKTYCPPEGLDENGELVRIHGADFIHCQRSLSDAKVAEMDQRVRDIFRPEDAEKILAGSDRWYWINKLEREALAAENGEASPS